MENTPKNFIFDRRTQGVLDVVKTNFESLSIGSGVGTLAVALFGEGKAITLVLPVALGLLLTVGRATVSRILALSITRNPILIDQSQTITQPEPLAAPPAPVQDVQPKPATEP